MQDDAAADWPGKADGVPRPPTAEELDEVSRQQALITDEWASDTAPSPGDAAAPPANPVPSRAENGAGK